MPRAYLKSAYLKSAVVVLAFRPSQGGSGAYLTVSVQDFGRQIPGKDLRTAPGAAALRMR